MFLVNWDGKAASLERGDILLTKSKGHTCIVLTANKNVVNKVTVAADKVECARQYNKDLAGEYKTTAALNLRVGAGATKKKVLVIPKEDKVVCYGYYTTVGNTKWLLVKYGNKTGFCSSKYLKKV